MIVNVAVKMTPYFSIKRISSGLAMNSVLLSMQINVSVPNAITVFGGIIRQFAGLILNTGERVVNIIKVCRNPH
jgi:hypothetical protein